MKPLYLEYRGTEQLKSYVKKSDTDFGTYLQFKNYDIAVSYAPKMPAKPLASGMIYELDEDKFLIVGINSSFTFRAKEGEGKKGKGEKREGREGKERKGGEGGEREGRK